jgi:hypothetical protein
MGCGLASRMAGGLGRSSATIPWILVHASNLERVPGSQKIAFIAGAHHAIVGGALVYVRSTKGEA